MRNRTRQRANRKLKLQEERMDKRNNCGAKDLTTYNAVQQRQGRDRPEMIPYRPPFGIMPAGGFCLLCLPIAKEKYFMEKTTMSVQELSAHMVIKGKAQMEELQDITTRLADFREVTPLRLYVDDVTTEKLTSVLAENNGTAAVVSAEGGIFDMLAGIYTKNVNIDVFLILFSN